jgi:glycosyltransferase involved in cell wall biosynthesis
MLLDLAVVMPAYNEEALIGGVVASWCQALANLGIRFRIVVLDDGSRDGTARALEAFADDHRVEVIHKVNTGHGPTILMGYRKAVELAAWVFQCDSDAEIGAEHFCHLWARRGSYDALFGARTGRRRLDRRIVSASSRLTVTLFFGRGVLDVNVPYRLIRSDLLRPIIDRIADSTFAPNVLVSGALAKTGARVYNHPVPWEARKGGTVSIARWSLWRGALRSLRQTLRFRGRLRRGYR